MPVNVLRRWTKPGTTLLNAAHSLMKESIPAERHPLLESKLDNPQLATLEERSFGSEELEVMWVVADVEQRIGEGVPAGDIAIMYRTNADATAVSRALSQKGILHALDSKSNIFKQDIFQMGHLCRE